MNSNGLGGTDFRVDTISKLNPRIWGATAIYSPHDKKVLIAKSTAAALKEGDPSAIHVASHEMLHSRQFSYKGSEGTTSDENIRLLSNTSYVHSLEGNNELATRLFMKDIGAGVMTNGPYQKEVESWAGVAMAHEKKTGISAKQFVYDTHKTYGDIDKTAGTFNQLFPTRGFDSQGYRAKEFGRWATTQQVNKYLSKDYGINSHAAYNEMMAHGGS